MRYNKHKFYYILISFWFLFCLGCSSSLQQVYDGPALSTNEIAQVWCTDYIKEIIYIDGKNTTDIKHSSFTGGPKIALLPGSHTLTAVFATNEERTITFTAEAGKSYELDRWGDDAVIIDKKYKKTWAEYQSKLYKGMNDDLLEKQIRSFIAPAPGTNDVIVRSLEHFPDVGIVSIDNKRYSSVHTGFALRLAPGPHTFEFWVDIARGFFQSSKYSKNTQEISGDLEAGCTYLIYSKADLKTDTWEPVLVKDVHHSVQSDNVPSNR